MSTKTGIAWTDTTWNPVTGCTKVSAGCKNCYAEAVANRWWKGRKFTDVRLHHERLDAPLRWRKPRRVFVNSMSDLFHDAVSFEFIAAVFAVMAAAERHTFQVLTKRPARMRKFLAWMADEHVGGALTPHRKMVLAIHHAIGGRAPGQVAVENAGWPLPNVWLGVSCENQEAANERIPLLIETPAAVKFLSCEPLLGPINLHPWLCDYGHVGAPEQQFANICDPSHDIDWVIVGGESGPGFRPMGLAWAQSLREQCRAAGVAFFFKQHSGPRPGTGEDVLGELVQEFPR